MQRYRPEPRWRREWRALPPYMKGVIAGLGVAGGVFIGSHVETMPLTDRRRLMLLSRAAEERIGTRAYEDILQRERVLPATHPMSLAVQRVGRQIVQQSDNADMKWKFHVLASPEPNAFCLPGGKVFVNAGLFSVLDNEDTLAAVMFHEAAHGLARHGAEKISFSLLAYSLLALLLPDYGQLSDLLVKIAVDLPFSRKLELEADAIGLKLMAKACYDPRASIQMNASLGKIDKENSVSALKYFSTHPPSEERIEALRRRLSDAMEIYASSGCLERKMSFRQGMQATSTHKTVE